MKNRSQYAFIVVGGLAVAGAAIWSLNQPRRNHQALNQVAPIARGAASQRLKADEIYGTDQKAAESEYRSFVEKHESSDSPEVQDEVAQARLRLGYLAAKRKDFAQARTTFLETKSEYKGTGAVGSDFGGIPDQAAYQAAVCLSADRKSAEAYRAFKQFFTDHHLSPLVHAAHRRLNILEPQHSGEHDTMLQAALNAQKKHYDYETSVCGPKAIAFLLTNLGKPGRDYKEIAKLCGTTGSGTTIEGMRKGLLALGVPTFGYELSREDLLRVKTPAILLKLDHYLVLLGRTQTHALVYDPRKKAEDSFELPKADQTDFSIPVLSLDPLELK